MASRGDTSRRWALMVELVPSGANSSGASGGASSSSSGVFSDGAAMDDVALDIDTLFRMVEQQFAKKTTPAPDEFLTISRVREPTRNVRPNEYTPHYVPIGPYHWSSSSQWRIDENKKSKYLAAVLGAISERTKEEMKVLPRELLQEMKNLDASSCYSDQYGGMGAEKFLHMLLLDGCYLLALFTGNPYKWSAPSPNNNGEPQQQQEDGLQPTTGGPTARTESATGAAEVAQAGGLTAPAAKTASRDDDVKLRETLYLLENQIPFFVVNKIYEFVTKKTPTTQSGHSPTTPSADTATTPSADTQTTPSADTPTTPSADTQTTPSADTPTTTSADTRMIPSTVLLTMFAARVKKELKEQFYISATADGPPPSGPSHLLHLVHTYFTRMKNSPVDQAAGGDAASSKKTGPWRRATEYCSYANVCFHRQEFDDISKAKSVLDVGLDVGLLDGALLVPLLRVDDNTWTILRNLMALEEHHAVSLKRHVTAYCVFMSQLACTEKDVALLRRSGVVEHFLGSDAEAAAGFADLCKGVRLDFDDPNSNYLKPVWHKLDRRCNSPWHNFAAWFRQTKCRNPWYVAALFAAVILFACQVLQAIYVIIDHIKRKK